MLWNTGDTKTQGHGEEKYLRFENTCDFVPQCLSDPKSSYIIILEIPSFITGTLKFKI